MRKRRRIEIAEAGSVSICGRRVVIWGTGPNGGEYEIHITLSIRHVWAFSKVLWRIIKDHDRAGAAARAYLAGVE